MLYKLFYLLVYVEEHFFCTIGVSIASGKIVTIGYASCGNSSPLTFKVAFYLLYTKKNYFAQP
jgi:hypothetical protein